MATDKAADGAKATDMVAYIRAALFVEEKSDQNDRQG
jgi:hypothetical protein